MRDDEVVEQREETDPCLATFPQLGATHTTQPTAIKS